VGYSDYDFKLPHLSKVRRDLEVYRRIIPCPIWVIGLKPD
jgi:hypothetical protein